MDSPALSTCALCRSAVEIPPADPSANAYCSDACRAKDAPIQALFSAAMAALPQPHTTNSKLAVLLPPDGDAPSLVYVDLKTFTDDNTGITFLEADTAPFFPADALPDPLHSEHNRVLGRDTLSMIEVWHVTSPPLPPNRCAAALAAGGKLFYEWKGPVLAMAMTRSTGFMVDPGSYRDVTMRDFRDIVDFVVDYGNTEHDKRIREALDTLGTKPQRVVEVVEEENANATTSREEQSAANPETKFELA